MKYKNQLILGSSILVIVLAVFIGVRLLGNEKDNSTSGKTAINNAIDDVADDGILENENIDGTTDKTKEPNEADKVDGDKDAVKDAKEDETSNRDDDSEKVQREEKKDDSAKATSKQTRDEEDIDDTTKDITEDKTNKTDKKVDEKQTDEKAAPKEEETSKQDEQDKNTPKELEETDKESKKDEKVVYVFKNKYVVQPKETLSDITKKCLLANKLEITNSVYLEHAKKLITKINNIADPNLIITGTKMIIPTKANFKGLLPKGEAYVIKIGDTIHDIVLEKMTWCEYFKAKEMLMQNNGINNENEIRSGITIYIPEKDSEV